MRIGTVLGICIALFLTGGCSKYGTHSSVLPSKLTSYESVKEPIPLLKKQPYSLYIIRADDGNVWRYSLDGSIKELVIESKALKEGGGRNNRIGLQPGRHTSSGALHLTCVPAGMGYTVVDGTPEPAPKRERFGPASLYRDPGDPKWIESPWSQEIKMEMKPVADHAHEFVDNIELTHRDGRKRKHVFDRGSESAFQDVPGIFASRYVLLKDGPQLLVWDLDSDKKLKIADVFQAVVWPRDVSKPERMKPIASIRNKGVSYQWKVKDPRDIYIRPEYRFVRQAQPRGPFDDFRRKMGLPPTQKR